MENQQQNILATIRDIQNNPIDCSTVDVDQLENISKEVVNNIQEYILNVDLSTA